jgi:murein DD-endopeptidase MepM/ murein hydrolase activator NlpD
VRLDELVLEVEKRVKAGDTRRVIGEWLAREVFKRWYEFAPLHPTPRASHRYRLPFDRRVHWIVGQGISTEGSHQGSNELALDFAMPMGTEVFAARRGRVARVVDGFTECCLPAERSQETNVVLVLHDDGSFATYAHLNPGIPVKEGQRVKVGALLGYSGNNGFSTHPHLHFQVSVRTAATRFTSVPFRFGNGTPEGYLPKAWRLYENRVRPGVQLRVSVDGRQLAPGEPFPLERAGPTQLQVHRVDGTGGSADVTGDPGTRYVALTPWSLRVEPGGRVVFGPSAEAWKNLPEVPRRSVAIVTVLFRDPDGREGYFDAWLVPAS